jgi:hypothetical protein
MVNIGDQLLCDLQMCSRLYIHSPRSHKINCELRAILLSGKKLVFLKLDYDSYIFSDWQKINTYYCITYVKRKLSPPRRSIFEIFDT